MAGHVETEGCTVRKICKNRVTVRWETKFWLKIEWVVVEMGTTFEGWVVMAS